MINQLYKVLSDPMRYSIIELLLSGERCSCTLIDKLPITQPTLSYHLKALVESGLVEAKRDKNKIHHFVKKEVLDTMILDLKHLKETKESVCTL